MTFLHLIRWLGWLVAPAILGMAMIPSIGGSVPQTDSLIVGLLLAAPMLVRGLIGGRLAEPHGSMVQGLGSGLLLQRWISQESDFVWLMILGGAVLLMATLISYAAWAVQRAAQRAAQQAAQQAAAGVQEE